MCAGWEIWLCLISHWLVFHRNVYDIQQSGDTGTLCTHVVLTIKDVVNKKKVSKQKGSIQDSVFLFRCCCEYSISNQNKKILPHFVCVELNLKVTSFNEKICTVYRFLLSRTSRPTKKWLNNENGARDYNNLTIKLYTTKSCPTGNFSQYFFVSNSQSFNIVFCMFVSCSSLNLFPISFFLRLIFRNFNCFVANVSYNVFQLIHNMVWKRNFI